MVAAAPLPARPALALAAALQVFPAGMPLAGCRGSPSQQVARHHLRRYASAAAGRTALPERPKGPMLQHAPAAASAVTARQDLTAAAVSLALAAALLWRRWSTAPSAVGAAPGWRRWPGRRRAVAVSAAAEGESASPAASGGNASFASAGSPAAGDTGASEEGKTPRWKGLSMKQLRKYGIGMMFAYGFVSNINACTMVAISWPIFIRQTGSSPIFFSPFRFNPKFIVFYGALYLSIGSLMRPFRFAIAAALAPAFDRILSTFQDRLGWPRWAALIPLILTQCIGTFAYFFLAIGLSCLLFRTPIWV